MGRSFLHFAIWTSAFVSLPAVASAEDARSIILPSQHLSASLQAIAQRFDVELLFSQQMVAAHMAPPVSGRLTVQQALKRVLAGSSLTVRKTSNGAYFIVGLVHAETEVDAIPDILVTGRRTQNTDIRRTENDVRPYRIITREDIATSRSTTVEELTGKLLSANAQGATLSQRGATAYGETASSIDLRGLGTSQTLVLIDGRRLPQLPGLAAGFIQPDVNAVSPETIDRVEAITATAGGVYGPGATAGVVNLVLRRDYRGVDLAATQGITSRGDAFYRRYDFKAGFTPDHGRTDVMIAVSQLNYHGLDVGDRDFSSRAVTRSYANDATTASNLFGVPVSSSINVVASNGGPLSFKPAYGGAALNTSYTHVTPADGRSSTALVAQLTKNAGSLGVRPGGGGSGETLLSDRRTRSIIASVRRKFGPVEVFADYLSLTNNGRARARTGADSLVLSADNPSNPFQQQITLTAPDPGRMFDFALRDRIERATGGIIVDLPGRWRGEADYSIGQARRLWDLDGRMVTPTAAMIYYPQIASGADSRNPLGDYASYVTSLEGTDGLYSRRGRRVNRFDDLSARFAGPVVGLNGGDLTATFVAEQRRERVRNGQISGVTSDGVAMVPSSLPAFAQTTRSLYGELRAPLVRGGSMGPGLELQLAVRRDWAKTRSPSSIQFFDNEGSPVLADSGEFRDLSDAATVYVAGFKANLLSGVLLRGSVSTGRQPLTVVQLFRYVYSGQGVSGQPDPKRGGETSNYKFDEIYGGPLQPRPERAQSLSIGAVLQPASFPAARLSIDYTHIVRSGENVSSSTTTTDFFIANEDRYPGRITRQPLTNADAARGFTAGTIASVDASGLQTGRTTVDAIDGQFDLRVPTAAGGALHFHLSATWQPKFRRQLGFGLPSGSYLNRSDGALAIRGNGGVQWSRGGLGLSLNAQLVGAYRITSGDETFKSLDADYVLLQGSARVPAQVTFDLGVSHRIEMQGAGSSDRPRTLDLRFGVQNVLDTRPAMAINAPGNYNVYVDPRRRRMELTVATAF